MLNKVKSIAAGWKNVIWETPEIKRMAEARAVKCAQCEHAIHGLVPELIREEIKDIRGMICKQCTCPLSAKLRSPAEKCPIDLWQAK